MSWPERIIPHTWEIRTRCSMRSRNFSRGFVIAPSRIEFWQQFFSPISSTLQSRQQRWVTGNGVNCCSNTRSLRERELARFRGRGVNTAGDYFLIAFDGPGRAIRCGMSISRRVRSLGIDTVSRPSSRNSWSEGARVDENSRLNWIRTPPGAAQECAGIRDLADRAVT